MTDSEYKWIAAHLNDNPDALRLAYHGRDDGFDYAGAIIQIECRRKFGSKLRRILEAFPKFTFPSVLAGEQATSDRLASYHASTIDDGGNVVDLTAGLGIDTIHIAAGAAHVTAIELDSARAKDLRYNLAGLGLGNVEVVEGDCIRYIDSCIASGKRFDTAFIDPARRASDGSRVYALSDCLPDVISLTPKLKQLSRHLMIKASPMLDITHTIGSLPVIPKGIAAVGTATECKELYIHIDFDSESEEPVIEAVTLLPQEVVSFSFLRSDENNASLPPLSAPLKAGDFIYEPYPSLMKTGVFKLLARDFNLSVFQPNTRLFYSTAKVCGFPGQIYSVLETMPYASKIIKRFKSRYPRIEVAVRNFSISADALRAKLGVRDGGDLRVYGYTDSRNEPMLAVVKKVTDV